MSNNTFKFDLSKIETLNKESYIDSSLYPDVLNSKCINSVRYFGNPTLILNISLFKKLFYYIGVSGSRDLKGLEDKSTKFLKSLLDIDFKNKEIPENPSELDLELIRNQAVLVSGLAKGLDSIASKCFLEKGRRLLAFIPCGFDHFRLDKELGELIVKNEDIVLIVSTYSDYSTWSVKNAMDRNRLITDISDAIIGFPVGESGGTMNACNGALKDKRSLYVPKFLFDDEVNGKGCKILVSNGAKVFESDFL